MTLNEVYVIILNFLQAVLIYAQPGRQSVYALSTSQGPQENDYATPFCWLLNLPYEQDEISYEIEKLKVFIESLELNQYGSIQTEVI